MFDIYGLCLDVSGCFISIQVHNVGRKKRII